MVVEMDERRWICDIFSQIHHEYTRIEIGIPKHVYLVC